jgi:hypothetical protein
MTAPVTLSVDVKGYHAHICRPTVMPDALHITKKVIVTDSTEPVFLIRRRNE